MQIAVQPHLKPLLLTLVEMHPERLESLSLDDLAEAAFCSRDTVKRHLKVLKKLEFVDQERKSDGRGAKYKFVVKPKAYAVVRSRP